MTKISHFLFSSLYFALLVCGFIFNFSLTTIILISLASLFLWKFFGGLAWHNLFILFSIMLLLFNCGLFFENTMIISLSIYFWVLFYLSALKWKKYPYLYDFARNIFFSSVLFIFFLTLNIFFFKLHYSSWFINLLLALGSALFIYWKILIDRLHIDLLDRLVLFIGFLEVSFLLLNLSGGFFVYPILSIFWFYTLFDLLESVNGKNLANKFNIWHILIPVVISVVLIFFIKI